MHEQWPLTERVESEKEALQMKAKLQWSDGTKESNILVEIRNLKPGIGKPLAFDCSAALHRYSFIFQAHERAL